ncbi:MAG: hypothetical protein QM790_07220 [Nibricoccus sp.]
MRRCDSVVRFLIAFLAIALGLTAADSAPLATAPKESGATFASVDTVRFNALFGPFVSQKASLSPDGKLLAFSVIEKELLHIAVMEVDHPDKLLTKVAVNSLKAMARNTFNSPPWQNEDRPLNVSWLSWVSSKRVVILTETSTAGSVLMSFDFNGENARVLASERTGATRNGYSFLGRSTAADCVILKTRLSFLRLNTVTGAFTKIKEAAALKETEQTRLSENAAKKDWKRVMEEIREVLPDKRLSLIENDVDGNRHLGLIEGMSDPGSFYVIDRNQRKAFDMVRRFKDYDPATAPVTTQFEFTTKEGRTIAGELCMPRKAKVKHVPVVVLMPEKLKQNVSHSFSREAFAFAQMGLASVRFESVVPEKKADEPERVRERQMIDQLVRVVDSLGDLHPVSKRRIILFGEQTAGYYALRALQIYPERFVGAIVIDPRLRDWDAPESKPENTGKRSNGSGIQRAILALATRTGQSKSAGSTQPELFGLVKEAQKAGAPAEFLEQPLDFRNKLPLARAAALREIERFVNTNVYDYVVKLGELEVLPD